MKNALIFPLRLLAFWLLFFAAFRLWFVLWFRSEWWPDAPGTVWLAFWHALPLDLSMAGYLMLLPVLTWFIGGRWVAGGGRQTADGGRQTADGTSGLSTVRRLPSAVSGFNFLLISVLVFVFGANVFIYEEWHTLLNNRAVEYLSTPRALLDSMSLGFKIGAVLLYVGAVWFFWKMYRWTVDGGRWTADGGRQTVDGRRNFKLRTSNSELQTPNSKLRTFLLLPLCLLVLVLMIRGLGTMPINESAVYYSPHPFHNHAATNTAWHLAHSQMEVRSTTNHFRFMPDGEAQTLVSSLMGRGVADGNFERAFFAQKDSTPLNVVFLIMESHTAQVVEELGGEPGVCPNLSRLIREGILFENCYGSGYRTDQGLVSVLAGYPAQPDQSIVLLSDKAAKLNSVPKALRERGYSSAFLYGGELTFANIGVWLSEQRFDKIVSEKDFPKTDKTQRWGVDDHRLLQRSLLEINQLKPPFFATAMTLSLHPPYDVPHQSRWQGGSDIRSKFLHSSAFADWAIGEFFRAAEQQPWYANTLFVLVADHGSASIGDIGQDNPLARHVPLVFLSPALDAAWRGRRVSDFCNHHDIPATVLPMLGVKFEEKNMPGSRDLWWWYVGQQSTVNPQQSTSFAYYTNENGLGWANSLGKGFYSFTDQTWQMWEGQLDSASQQQAKAYLQVLYEDFLAK